MRRKQRTQTLIPRLKTPGAFATVAGPTGRVLVFDDDENSSRILMQMLVEAGHQASRVRSLEEAVQECDQTDVVVVDCFAPELPGLKLIDHLRRLGATVIIATSLNDVEVAVNALHRGAADFLLKPISSSRLLSAVARSLERSQMVEENGRLKRDLTLFAAGQRLLETLDLEQLAYRGIDAMCSYAVVDAAILIGPEGPMVYRGLSDELLEEFSALPALVGDNRFSPQEISPALSDYTDAMILDLGDGRWLVMLRGPGEEPFSIGEQENALFLSRHLSTAFKNTGRFAQAEEEAMRDPLTGLWNAQAFNDLVEQAVEQCAEAKDSFALLFLDLDRFKNVNDTYGHLMGSRLLVEFGQTILHCLRTEDFVARFGGDEFVVLLTDVQESGAMQVAERIRAKVADRFFLARERVQARLTTSIGVALYPEDGQSAEEVLDSADRAMYFAKAASRNAVHKSGDDSRSYRKARGEPANGDGEKDASANDVIDREELAEGVGSEEK
ncbi:MAG: diguanylate cyclase [Deltaproteobacteria bacterium]|nr:diguanylate cyclase [Deltaproteobacteria bacterium]